MVNNPVFNIVNQALVRFPRDLIVTGIDKVTKALGFTPTTNVIAGQSDFFKKLGEGTVEAAQQVATGLNSMDYFQKVQGYLILR